MASLGPETPPDRNQIVITTATPESRRDLMDALKELAHRHDYTISLGYTAIAADQAAHPFEHGDYNPKRVEWLIDLVSGIEYPVITRELLLNYAQDRSVSGAKRFVDALLNGMTDCKNRETTWSQVDAYTIDHPDFPYPVPKAHMFERLIGCFKPSSGGRLRLERFGTGAVNFFAGYSSEVIVHLQSDQYS